VRGKRGSTNKHTRGDKVAVFASGFWYPAEVQSCEGDAAKVVFNEAQSQENDMLEEKVYKVKYPPLPNINTQVLDPNPNMQEKTVMAWNDFLTMKNDSDGKKIISGSKWGMARLKYMNHTWGKFTRD
jgi:hypothetical protein